MRWDWDVVAGCWVGWRHRRIAPNPTTARGPARSRQRQANRTFTETIGSMQADPANVEPVAFVLFAAYYLERIGDRVTNIAEDVVYLAIGQVEDLNP